MNPLFGYSFTETDLSGLSEHPKEMDNAPGKLGSNGAKIGGLVSRKNGAKFALN